MAAKKVAPKTAEWNWANNKTEGGSQWRLPFG
jgi:hypothetical protein